MLNTKSFVAIDFGAGSLKLAEFEVNEAGSLVLSRFFIKPLGLEGSQESKREALILKKIQEIIAEQGGIGSKNVNVCAPGFHVFSKFVKLPPVDSGKVTQMIQYEAQQNVPFPLAEVVWDYQILGTTPGGELEVLLVAIKSDIVEGLFRVTESAGLKLEVCDVSPAALCNAFRYNYGDLEDCTMLLDIGAKTSNLLFFEKGKVFSRSINLGANSITQDFASEAKLKFDAAEKIKLDEGFVSLGGAYEEPESPNQAAISKIARQFMTRLHIQVNQTLQFYRGQQGGAAPQRLFLSGGASIMGYTAQFFAEKLNVPVEYFNPFRNVQIDPSVDLEELSRVAHSLGEVVGLALRNVARCPVELNLMPESTLRWQSFNEKKPYFLATIISLILMAFAVGFLFDRLAGVKQERIEKLNVEIQPMQTRADRFRRANGELNQAQTDLALVADWVEERYFWADLCRELRNVLIRVEAAHKRKLGVDTGVWIEQIRGMRLPAYDPLNPYADQLNPYAPRSDGYAPTPGMYPGAGGASAEERAAFAARYGAPAQPTPAPEYDIPGGAPPPTEPPAIDPNTGMPVVSTESTESTNEVSKITVLIRGVDLTQSGFPAANTDIAFALETEFKNNPLFDPEGTRFAGEIVPDPVNGTWGVEMALKLKRPIKL